MQDIRNKYPEIVDTVTSHNIIGYYKNLYRTYVNKGLKNYLLWVDYLLDKYNQYQGTGFTKVESKINALSDGLEALVKAYEVRK